MKRAFVNMGLIAGSVLISLVILELIARSFYDVPSPYPTKPGIIVYDQRGFWSMEPGLESSIDNIVDFRNKQLTIHENGSRKLPCLNQTGTHAQDIYLIGDSQTFGWGLSDDETWANQTQCLLNKKVPGRYRISNLGVPGIQVDQYVMRGIRQVLQRIKNNDIVVISMTWNDLVGFYSSPDWVTSRLKDAQLVEGRSANGGIIVTADPAPQPGHPGLVTAPPTDLNFVGSRPYTRLAPETWRYNFYQQYGLFVPMVDSAENFLYSMNYVSAGFRLVWSRAKLLFYKIRPADSFFKKVPADSYKFNFLSLKALSHRLEKQGARVLVQFLPNRVFFDDYYYYSYSKNGTVFPVRDFFWHIGKPFCDSLKLNCINRFDDLKTSDRDAHTFSYDGHYNAIAAERIGLALARDIIDFSPPLK
ncbi:MAG: SGNH/GDSL hydrolase family protein [Rhodospirillales bacterium]|nr:SGNH/GDSL hydrolase family protein [Rhodospirillales bacterium]